MNIEKNVLLAPYTTFGIGGPARYFTSVTSEEELGEALEFARKEDLRIFVLGGGSNILFSDQGFNGLVIHNQIKGFEFIQEKDQTLISCGAGEAWDDFVALTVRRGLSGLELLSGIPGTLGAAPVQNIGAYGTSMDSVLHELRAYDREIKKFKMFTKEDCQFGYRSSIFKKEKDRYIITRVTCILSDKRPVTPSYHDLRELFSDATTPSVAEIRAAVIRVRASKGMVIMPEYESYRSAGSFFQNPVISHMEFERVRSIAEREGEAWLCSTPWYWALSNDQVKVSAACLIQQAGFPKGHREGTVGLSPRHTLAIVNYENSKAEDVLRFADSIGRAVYNEFAVTLEREVQLVDY